RPPRGGARDNGQNRQRDEQKGEPEVQGVAQHVAPPWSSGVPRTRHSGVSQRRNHSGDEAPVRRAFGLVRPPRGGAGDDGQNRQRDEQKGEPEVQGVAQHVAPPWSSGVPRTRDSGGSLRGNNSGAGAQGSRAFDEVRAPRGGERSGGNNRQRWAR